MKSQNQATFISMADEFYLLYLLAAHNKLRGKLVTSRLFVMGHCLELYVKANLIDAKGNPPHGHDIDKFIKKIDQSLSLSDKEIKLSKNFFAKHKENLDLGVYMKNVELFELYLAQFYTKDLKYYVDKEGENILDFKISLKPINFRFVNIVYNLRKRINFKNASFKNLINDQLITNGAEIGFEPNPAEWIIDGLPEQFRNGASSATKTARW